MKVLQYLTATIFLQCVLPTRSSERYEPSDAIPYYTPLTSNEVQRLKSWTPQSKEPMWQISGQFEGDMVLQPGNRNGAIDIKLRWPNRVIPYQFSGNFTRREKLFIAWTLANEFAKTCVRVRPRRGNETDYVYITSKNWGCSSLVGRLGGRQTLNLQKSGCLNYGTIVHEFSHAAGLYHQHSASNRDDWVYVLWKNIQKGRERNFEKFAETKVNSYGLPYDYNSLMHYNMFAFSRNNLPTIIPKDPNAHIGQHRGFSIMDIIKLNRMYNCF